MTHQKYFLILSSLFLIVFLILAISPYDRADWALENVAVLIFALVMTSSYKKFPFSRISYSLIFIFMCLHEIGAHYTYARVPYDSFFMNTFNLSLNELMDWERNHYDRFVHFLYGLFMAYPFREVYCRFAYGKGFWGYFFPLLFTITASLLFELLEWAAVEIFGGELGMAFLGTQGDIWDAHKDMGLAALGAVVAMMIVAGVNLQINKNFFKDWRNSLRIKRKKPMGEDEIVRLMEEQDKK
jgi:putative membrane protein